MVSNALAGQSSASFDAKRIYPTPNFEDLIVLEVLSRSLENYGALAYGTAYPDANLFPNHRLVLQVEQSKEFVVRYYATDRAAQDAYNYDISYLAESNAHPVYSRTYVVKRADYAVVAKLTPDPVHVTALLVKEDMQEKTGDERIDSLYVLVRRVYQTLPGPPLTGYQRSEAVRGRSVNVVKQVGATGTLPIESGSLIIDSEVTALDSVRDERVTRKIDSLPPDEVSAFWEAVSIPSLLFALDHTIFCDNSPFASINTSPVLGGGSSALRKHRKTVQYWSSPPDPDLSASSYAKANIQYQGKEIRFSYQDVLNDALSYSQDLVISNGTDSCTFTETYSFGATTPSATTFAAGVWYTKSFTPEIWKESMWKSTHIEFFSAEGNPSI